MRALRWGRACLAVALLLLVGAPVVHAEIDGTNACEAAGTWREGGFSVDAAATTGVVVIPRSDMVEWTGSVPLAPGQYRGSIWVELPPPFGSVEIDTWEGDSQSTSNNGTHEYDLPALVPAGIEFVVSGQHVDENGRCDGSVTVEIDGGRLGAPLAAISLAGTAITAAAMAALLRPMFRKAP